MTANVAHQHAHMLNLRESKLLCMILDGCSRSDIARATGLAEADLVTELKRVLRRLSARADLEPAREDICPAAGATASGREPRLMHVGTRGH